MKLTKIYRFVFNLLFLLICCSSINAQKLDVSNVRFEDMGETVLVRYDLNGETGKKYRVTLSLSDDNGAYFQIFPRSVSGDIGKNITPGKDKLIIWYLTEDYTDGLSGDRFIFAVDAELQKGRSRLPYYVLGAGVVGGVVYSVMKSSKEESKPSTGSIIIDVPKDF